VRIGKRAQKVRFHIHEGPSIEGLLLGRSKGEYLVGAGRVFQDETSSMTVGQISITRERVLFYQHIEA